MNLKKTLFNSLFTLIAALVFSGYSVLCFAHDEQQERENSSQSGEQFTPQKPFKPSLHTVEQFPNKVHNGILTIYVPEIDKKSLLSATEYRAFTGYQQELFALVAQNAGLKFQIKIRPLDDIKKAIARNEYAIATSLPFHTYDNQKYGYSLPYIDLKISEFQSVTLNKKPKVLISNQEYQRIKNLLNDHQVQIYYGTAERNKYLLSESFDIIRSPFPAKLHQKLKELGIEANYTEINDANNPLLMRAVTHKNHGDLLRVFNAGLRHITSAELEYLNNKYLVVFGGQIKDRLSMLVPGLSDAEEDFAISHPYIDFIAEPNHSAPFIFVDQTRISGYWVDILHQISLRTGLVFRPKLVSSLTEGVNLVANNDARVFTGIVRSTTHTTPLAYTIPYDKYTQQIISTNSEPYSSLHELNGKQVAAVKNFRLGQLVKQRYPGITIVEFESTSESLKAVSEGRVDAAVGNAFAATYQAQAMGHTNLRFTTITSLKNEQFTVHMATAQNSPELLSLLNKGLKLADRKTMTQLKKSWNNFSFDTSYLERSYRIKLFFVLIVLIAVLLGSFAINRFTRRKMHQEQRHHEYTRRMLEQVEEAKQQVVKANKEQSYFFARMTHEIRTPLNGLFGMAEALAMSDLNDQQRQNLTILQQSGKNLVSILDDILDLSKIDSGNLSLKYKACDIEQQLNSCLAAFGERAKAKSLDLRLVLKSKLNKAYMVDPLRLTQIINNLVSNAIKFTDEGHVFIKVKKLANDQGLEFVVSDSGVGIPANKTASIFDAYRQANDEVQSIYGGTGLGLSICKELVNKMGGRIWVHSEAGKGTDFYFHLPLKATDEKPHEFIDKNTLKEQSLPEYPNLKLLMAEDNLVNQKVLCEQLKLFKIFPDVANNGAEAWEMYQHKDYDIVLSDCHMPEMDGFELAKKITAYTEKKAPYLIAITADALNGSDNACFDAGFNDYLKKPINRFQLAAALSKAFESANNSVELIDEVEAEKSPYNASNQFMLINTAMVSELCAGDTQTIKSMLQNFLDTVSEYDNIEALVRTDSKALNETVHKLKGSSQYFGADHLVALCKKLTESDLSYQQRANYAAQIKAQLKTIKSEANAWLTQLS